MCFVVVDFKFRVLCFVKFHLLAIWVIFREKCLTGCVTVAYNAAFQEMELEGGGEIRVNKTGFSAQDVWQNHVLLLLLFLTLYPMTVINCTRPCPEYENQQHFFFQDCLTD